MTREADEVRHWSGRKYVVDMTAMTVEVNCHYKPKAQFPTNVVLLAEANYTSYYPVWVYMTEGPRTPTNPEFTDSYQVIFDTGNITSFLNGKLLPTSKIVVCSILTRMQPAVTTSLALMFRPEYAEYRSLENKTIQFHEHWLDSINWMRNNYDIDVTMQFANWNLTVPPRNMSVPTRNVYLAQFGSFLGSFLLPILNAPGNNMAMNLETVVSAAFLSIYSCSGDSDSQYPAALAPLLLDSVKPESPIYPLPRNLTVTVYNLGYGFRLSSRTGILGVTILIAHAVIVVLGSLWQLFWWRSVITAWGTIPDYIALGLESEIPLTNVLDNTCAGITVGITLQNLARVGETTDQHLEITVGAGTGMKSVLGKPGAKYGSRGSRSKEKLE